MNVRILRNFLSTSLLTTKHYMPCGLEKKSICLPVVHVAISSKFPQWNVVQLNNWKMTLKYDSITKSEKRTICDSGLNLKYFLWS